MRKNFLDKLAKLLHNQQQHHNVHHKKHDHSHIHTPFEQHQNQFIKNDKEHHYTHHTSPGFNKFFRKNKVNKQ